jgi:hypothetical protein
MTSNTSNNELSTPLLSNFPQHESDADAYDEESCMPCSFKINIDDDDKEEEESDDDSSQCTRWCDNFVSLVALEEESDDDNKDSSQSALWCDDFVSLVVLPALLFLSFGEALYTSSVDANTGLRWSMVNYSIVIFVVIAALYRQAVQDCKITYLVAILLPEILIVIVLYLVLFGEVVPAFFLLLSSTLCLAVFVVASNIGVLVEVFTMIHQRRLL